tara:strand:+ start:1311 stop:1553 length:243 start_codon:yes stop_codon:yes gene_type:complete
MAKSKAHEELIEAVVDYKRGLRNLKTGSDEISRISGLTPDIVACFLKAMKRDNVTQIRGYSKEPEHLRKANKRKAPPEQG